MNRYITALPLLAALITATACAPDADQAGDGRDVVTASAADSMGRDSRTATGAQRGDRQATGEHAAESHVAEDHTTGSGEGQALLPIMQQLGVEMMSLTNALMMQDHATMTRSAAAIAEHAPISAEELARLHAALGSDMAAFEALDDSVHVAAVRLHEAARSRGIELVADRLGEMQRGCVACHAQFQARLRTTGSGR